MFVIINRYVFVTSESVFIDPDQHKRSISVPSTNRIVLIYDVSVDFVSIIGPVLLIVVAWKRDIFLKRLLYM